MCVCLCVMLGMTGVILKMQVSDTGQEKVQLISFCQAVEFLLSKQGDKLKANDSPRPDSLRTRIYRDTHTHTHTHTCKWRKVTKVRGRKVVQSVKV